MNIKTMRQRLLGSSVLAAMAVAAPLGVMALPGVAQAQAAATSPADQEIVVTGSIIRRKNVDSDSPLTVVTAAELDQRGITTIQSAVQNLSANNAGALPNSFSANGAFAAGASGASLRGLTTNSTLVLIDGLRAAYYPLADDGARNFVDLNTIPDVIVDRVEVLQDGASSTYGADAIAGVINVITKKTYQGFMARVEGGFRGDGSGGNERNIQALWGHGDLGSDGYNVYLGAEYEKDSILYSRQLGFPYNTANFSSLCAPSVYGTPASATATGGTTVSSTGVTCRTNGVVNGVQAASVAYPLGQVSLGGTDIVAVVRPYNATNTAAVGNYQLLNPAAGCGTLTSITVQPSQVSTTAAGQATAGASAPVTLCQQDFRHDYSVISPSDERFSISGHFIKNIGTAQVYVEGNYYQNDVFVPSSPGAVRFVTPPATTGITFSNTSIALPVYVCPTGSATFTCTATSPGATLNPNNPFAAAGNVARLYYSFGDIPRTTEEFSQTYRLAGGVNGSFGQGWNYSADITGMQSDLTKTQNGVLFVNNILTAINQGTYNFANPSANTAAIRNYVSPTSIQDSSSRLVMAQGNISKTLFQLPGGPLQLGVIGAIRYESLYNPSANGDSQGIYNRYTSSINPFGAIGSRSVYSGAFELDAPIFKQLDINFSGRYDKYSSGQDNFSPKVGAKFTPVQWLTLRGTYSQGFRIPAFAEANSLPTTGYVTVNAPAGSSCYTTHASNTAYCQNYSLGLTTLPGTGLQPEKSENITGGIVLQPLHNLSFTFDFYHIKKTGVIGTPDYTPALTAYYAGAAIPAGFKVIADLADPSNPAALPRAGFVVDSLQNLNQEVTQGYDFSANYRQNLPWDIKWTSNLSGTYVDKLDVYFPASASAPASVQHYAGTLGPYQITSASGTPRLRFNWQNTVSYGKATLTATAYYTSGYHEKADDNGDGGITTCQGNAAGTVIGYGTAAKYRDGKTVVVCSVKSFTDVQLHATYDLTKKIQLFIDIDNLFDTAAPYDPTTYGGSNYNPAWANSGVYGRYFKLGAKATF